MCRSHPCATQLPRLSRNPSAPRVNHVVCHGIPSERKVLKDGDIINVDITVLKDGFHGDTSAMFGIGIVAPHAQRLVRITQECLLSAIELVRPGSAPRRHRARDPAARRGNYYSVVREYCGHGIGRIFHEEPQVLHYGQRNTGLQLREGMTFTIEPMINAGKRFIPNSRRATAGQ
jgi:methionyl aminopeptidase